MALSAPIFYDVTVYYIVTIVMYAALIVEAVALIHCITQRGDGFQAIGALPKGAWIALLALSMVLTYFLVGFNLFFPAIGIGAALIYLLDVRQGLKDLSDGKGFW